MLKSQKRRYKPKQPKCPVVRIISLNPSLTDILISLKAGDILVGVSHFCEVKEGTFERIGGPKALELSKIAALQPEWILADSTDNRPEEIETLRKRWKVKVFEARKLDRVCDAVAELGRLVDRRKEAESLSEAIQNEIVENEKVFQGVRRKRTILLIWNQPYVTVNFDTYPSRLLEVSGGENVFRREPLREFPVEMEDLVEKDPELLLLAGEPAPFREKHIAEFRRYRIFSRIPIHLVEGKLLSRYGPQTVQALRHFREIFRGLS